MSAEAPRPFRRRWWLHALFGVAVIAALVILFVAWLVATPGGASLVLERAARFLGQDTQFTGVEGSLSGTLRIQSLEVKRPDLLIRIRDLEIERAPDSATLSRVVFRRLNASFIEVRTASTGSAASVPLQFKAPYPLRVESAHVGELRIGRLAKDGEAGGDIVLKDITLTAEGDDRAWKLENASAQTQWGGVNLAGTLEAVAPFGLNLRGAFTGERDGSRYRIDGQLAGTLKRIEATFTAEDRDLRGTGTAVVEPFEKQPLRSVSLRARDVDIARFMDAPHTRLAIDGAFEPSGTGFAGAIHVVNSDPGPIDRARLPIVSGDARVTWTREGENNRVDVNGARLSLAGGGSAQGSARWHPRRLEGEWRVANVDLVQLHTRLRPTRLGGNVSVTSGAEGQRFQLALTDPRFAIDGEATLKASRLDVQSVRVKHAGGVVEGKGFITLAQRRDFRFEGRAQHFDPSAFVKGPAGDVNFDFVASGVLEPTLAGDVKLDIAQSRVGDLPASGTLRLVGDARRIANADVKLLLGETRLQAQGAFGRPGDAMVVAIQSTNLAPIARPLNLALAGKLDARATLTGTFAAPAGQFEFNGSNLAMPGGFYAAGLTGRGEIGADANANVAANIEARGLTRRSSDRVQSLAERAVITLEGTRSAHRANVVATLARDSEGRAVLQGGLDPREPRPLWRGQLASLTLTGPSAFALVSPASLVAAVDRVEVGDATLKGTWGEARFATTRWTPALLELRGSSPGIGIRNAARALRLQALPRGNLVVAADWNVRAADTVDGVINVARTSGDLRIGDPPQPLELDLLRLKVESQRGRARATVNLHGARVGTVSADIAGTLEPGGFNLLASAPIEGRVDAEMDSLTWMAAWMGPEAKAEGRASAHVTISGTAGDPRWSGRIAGENISVREPQSGFEVEKGVVALQLRDRALVVEKLVASTPWHPSEQAARAMQGVARHEAGTLSAEGAVDLGARTGAIVIKASSVPVTQLPTRFLALSGEAKLEARGDGLLATGAFKADAGWIGALATALPTVSEDVVVRRASVIEERGPRERLRMDVRFSIGDNVWFQGRGLNTKLRGDLRIAGEAGAALRGTGSIRTVSGTYDAYGQKLSIERGTLTFFGSLENPTLDVLALRKGLPVEAGVEVGGNVAHPRVRLVSIPEVPDPEKISWLVLGRGPGDVSQGEASTLVAAANAILGRSTPTGQIARRFGFDDVRIGRADTTSALGTLPQSTVAGRTGSASAAEVVTVGKRLSKDIYVVYEQGLADAEGALRITWQITQKFQMLLRAGYLPGVDAVYRWTFE